MRKEADDYKKALECAFLLLKYRLRSEQEIRSRLKKRKFALDLIEKAVSFLKEKKFIDDSIFAKAWIDSRIKRRFGLRRIERELILKGVAKDTISAQLSRVKNNYVEVDTVNEIAGARLAKLKGLEPQIAKRRIYAYLMRRGFSPDVVYEVIGQL